MFTYFVIEIFLFSFHLLWQQKLLKLHSLIHSVTTSILQLYNIYIVIWNNSLVVTVLKPLIRDQGHSCQPRPAALYFLHSGHWLPVVSNNFFHFRIADNSRQLFRSWVTPSPLRRNWLHGGGWQTEESSGCPDPSHTHICVLLGSGMKFDWLLAGRPSECPQYRCATHSLYWSPDMRMSQTLRNETHT